MLKIDIGCGYKLESGFVGIDSDINTKATHILDLEKDKLPFSDSEVDFVKAHHILEHIGDGFFHLMQEIYRVSKNGAIVDVQVPHPRHEYFLNDPTHKRPITVETMKMFSKSYNRWTVEQGWSCSTIGIMYDVDFELLDYTFIRDPFYDGIEQKISKEVGEILFREGNNIFTEIHMKLMVVK